jgi:hypothetical protein
VTVGTAFDYLLRFEFQRLAPHAVVEPWVAEAAPDIIWRRNTEGRGAIGLDLLRDFESTADYLPPAEASERARAIVMNAQSTVASYLKSKIPTAAQRSELAAHAIRLAKLDQVLRERRLDPHFQDAEGEDAEDLLSMLGIVPFEALLHPKTMLLNPTFGKSSEMVGGADADLITGDLLVDFKVTRRDKMQARDLDQLLGYYLLVRHHRQHDPTVPDIKRAALYFCRHGLPWQFDTTVWTNHPDFRNFEQWFFKRVTELSIKRQAALERLREQAKAIVKRG